MTLYEQWQDKMKEQEVEEAFFANYIEKEKDAYDLILKTGKNILKGTVTRLSEEYEMDAVTFTGFLDGVNTSLKEELNIEALDEDSEISIEIDFEKLYYNMLKAKANWLYNLDSWEEIVSAENRSQIRQQYNEDSRAVSTKIGRNDPCPCGSGKKYKKCCGK